MRKSAFKNRRHYHLNLDFETHPLFKQIDWIFIQKKIRNLASFHKIGIHALVMMDTHVHLIFSSQSQNENFFCETFQNEIAPNQKSDCFCEPLLCYSQYLNAYKYVYRNPIEAGLCSRAENYAYSSLQILLGHAVGYLEFDDQLALIQNPIQILKWINTDQDFKASQIKFLRQDNSSSI